MAEKLTEEDRAAIRASRELRSVLALRYNVSEMTIWRCRAKDVEPGESDRELRAQRKAREKARRDRVAAERAKRAMLRAEVNLITWRGVA